MRNFAIAAFAAAATALTGAQQATSSSQHHADVDRRGAAVMGFDQQRTAHHFFLYPDGGAIDVEVKNAADTANLEAIRRHLPYIATMFAKGNFEAPMLVHETNVPGTAELATLKDRVTYTYEATPRGGRVNIVTTDAEALAALHRFLTFQIADHRTGDSTDIRKR